MQGVDASIELQRVYVGENGIEEIVTQFRHLAFVEALAVNEVLQGLAKNLDLHFMWSSLGSSF